MSFQSRVGRERWLHPYTDETVRALAGAGVKRLDVVSPGFAVDCLETLEEIAMQNREFFLTAGGSDLRYIPALNDSPGPGRRDGRPGAAPHAGLAGICRRLRRGGRAGQPAGQRPRADAMDGRTG